MKIYSGNLRGEGDKKINKRLKKIKRRAAKKTARRFRRDMRILDTRIPLDIKEKLTKCANMVIEAELNIKSLKYKLRKSGVRGAARRDMKRAIKENRAKIKYHVRDYRRFLKKAKRYVEKIKVVRKQIVAILITIAVLVVATLLYLRFESQVNGFFARIFRFVR